MPTIVFTPCPDHSQSTPCCDDIRDNVNILQGQCPRCPDTRPDLEPPQASHRTGQLSESSLPTNRGESYFSSSSLCYGKYGWSMLYVNLHTVHVLTDYIIYICMYYSICQHTHASNTFIICMGCVYNNVYIVYTCIYYDCWYCAGIFG